MARLILLLFALLLVFLVVRWFVSLPAERVARALRWGLFSALVGVLVLLAATGRLKWLFALAASAIPLLRRLLPQLLRHLPWISGRYQQYRAGRSRRRPAPGQRSSIETAYLRMYLDHDSGEMSGEVLDGRFQGLELNELTLEQLLTLYDECQARDPESVALLEAYLDRVHGDHWREQAGAGAAPPAGDTAMTHEEALQILGLHPGASEAEIIAAHRRLMQKVHPDRGGSDWLASKLNQAKELLLG